jgi:SOS response regulatory protein OraA/RecX
VAELRDRLERKEFEKTAIDDAIRRLQDRGALDDARVALSRARQDALKRRGPRRILLQLHAIGIKDDVAREAVREVFADGEEERSLEQAFDRRVRSAHIDLGDRNAVRKLQAHLIRRGFSPGAVSALVRERTGSGPARRSR